MTDGDAIIIDTPEGIAHYRLITVIAAVKLEARGFRFKGGSISAMAIKEFNLDVPNRRKETVRDALCDLYIERYGARSTLDEREKEVSDG